MQNASKYIFWIVSCFITLLSSAQATYFMDNMTVNDCEGIFNDSDAKPDEAGYYDHNEEYVFTISLPGSERISMVFSSFCTELDYDVLTFHDGPTTNDPIIAAYSGEQVPAPVTATSGYLTIHFVSDASKACDGWVASWDSDPIEPESAQINPIGSVDCFAESVILTFDKNIPCNQVRLSSFQWNGPSSGIASVSPINCTNDSTQQVEVVLSAPISSSGNYSVVFNYNYIDPCGELWEFEIDQTFEVTNCPLEVEIIQSATACAGSCINLTAEVTGGDGNYTYQWGNGLPSQATVEICPTAMASYCVTVQDGAGATPASTCLDVQVKTPPEAGADTTICRADPQFFMSSATPAGGTWSGPQGIRGDGRVRAWELGPGSHKVYYTFEECVDSLTIMVLDVNAGGIQAACPGGTPFIVNGGTPVGGNWSGPNIDPDGTFHPDSIGEHRITYTADNGCAQTKVVNVEAIWVQADTVVCANIQEITLQFSPLGGRWNGPGMTHRVLGRFSPRNVGVGSYELTYAMNGCVDTVVVDVQAIEAGPNVVVCPLSGLEEFSATPIGGIWSGIGIVDSNTGQYNPSLVNNGADYQSFVKYSANGCSDSFLVRGIATAIAPVELDVCHQVDTLSLEISAFHYAPRGGVWSGIGATPIADSAVFEPSNTPVGSYYLQYEANGCSDSVLINVHATPVVDSLVEVCEVQPAFELFSDSVTGVWTGFGITDSIAGIFDPALTGKGRFNTLFTDSNSCSARTIVSVTDLPVPKIQGILGDFCFKNDTVRLSAQPTGGVWRGAGIFDSINGFLNTSLANEGTHVLTYTIGEGLCAVTTQEMITVLPPLAVHVPFTDTILCYNEHVYMYATASGGVANNYCFYWDNSKVCNPEIYGGVRNSRTRHRITVYDGCSDPATDTLIVNYYDPIEVEVASGSPVCFGEENWGSVKAVQSNKKYQYVWQTDPVFYGEEITTTAGRYSVEITDLDTRCISEASVDIMDYDTVVANFRKAPTGACIPVNDATVTFTNLSSGASAGFWDFGDGAPTMAYSSATSPNHTYTEPGLYTVTLHVWNEIGCEAQVEQAVCIEAVHSLFAPTAFSPNGDGVNDRFIVKGTEIERFRMYIFNRWGEELFFTNDMSVGWDGTYQGQTVANDVYTYLIEYASTVNNRPLTMKGTFGVVR